MGAAIATLHMDFTLWTALGWICPTGRVSLKEFGTRIVFWPETCIVESTKAYVQVAKTYVQVAKSYVQVAKFSSSVFL